MISILDKAALFASETIFLRQQGLRVVYQDHSCPWGGFFLFDNTQARQFIHYYFNGQTPESLRLSEPLSFRVLLVAPQQRLSWQYHRRRAELWQVVQGPVGVVTSPTDAEGELRHYMPGERLSVPPGERHRLVGLDDWGVVAEIWQHTDATHLSDEADVVRVQDDFGR